MDRGTLAYDLECGTGIFASNQLVECLLALGQQMEQAVVMWCVLVDDHMIEFPRGCSPCSPKQ